MFFEVLLCGRHVAFFPKFTNLLLYSFELRELFIHLICKLYFRAFEFSINVPETNIILSYHHSCISGLRAQQWRTF